MQVYIHMIVTTFVTKKSFVYHTINSQGFMKWNTEFCSTHSQYKQDHV